MQQNRSELALSKFEDANRYAALGPPAPEMGRGAVLRRPEGRRAEGVCGGSVAGAYAGG